MGDLTKIVCVFGRRGTGKTTLAVSLAAQELRLLVWDPFLEHDAVWCPSLEALCDHAERHKLDMQPASRFRLGLSDGETDSALGLLVLAQALTKCTVVLEEVDLVARPAEESPIFRRAVAQGRHWGLSMICTSRRPAEVPRLLTSQASDLYVFASHEPRDIQYLKAVMGEAAEQVPTLPQYTCLHWTPRDPLNPNLFSLDKVGGYKRESSRKKLGEESREATTGGRPMPVE